MAKRSGKEPEKLSSISVRIPTDLLEKCRSKTDNTGVPISFVVRKALENWVELEPPDSPYKKKK